ncbi:hypothetical protein BU26DRAFT_338314 [Trematosphaeria pertusa]|uniref:Uncharacterized protein n=1 Tax=Trematosphaeria pertusa TaxID=390896 RepID=A0A6A6IDB8_9PLEO|nr:uncharacterized protein BU26DRAFT_338314 [Trematosphaeria pertusa]KAF2248575.1 hypothetical protein BU26DRAFT_338314 [Trematosphaeria pertusa]
MFSVVLDLSAPLKNRWRGLVRCPAHNALLRCIRLSRQSTGGDDGSSDRMGEPLSSLLRRCSADVAATTLVGAGAALHGTATTTRNLYPRGK